MNAGLGMNNIASAGEVGRIQNTPIKPGLGEVGSAGDFQGLLNNKIAPEKLVPNATTAGAPTTASPSEKLKFSAHAVERMRSRGISMNPETLEKLTGAVDKAEKKGAKETLILTGDAALIVNIKNRTVITAMDKGALKDNVFTNIDSTVVI